jgi:glycosyltransferase involved in cell wall biosynthesis
VKSLLCVNSGGVGNLHGLRMRRLTTPLAGKAEVIYHDLARGKGRRVAQAGLRELLDARNWDLVYLESTGIAAGWPLIQAKRRRGQRFIVSSGDPVGGFFKVTRGPLWGLAFGAYERLLYRSSAAFVGWTPYLTGAALKLGARRAVTIEGGADLQLFRPGGLAEKKRLRARFGLPESALVCGVVGSLVWSPRQKYCYGLELVEIITRLRRQDVVMFIVGDGDALERLRAAVPEALRQRVVFPGRLSEPDVVDAMNAMDIGFIVQTLDALGNFRLTTKMPEYLACGLPIAMSPIPGFYDYAKEVGWALPPLHPASAEFHRQAAIWLDALTREEIDTRRAGARALAEQRFDYGRLAEKFSAFIEDLWAP